MIKVLTTSLVLNNWAQFIQKIMWRYPENATITKYSHSEAPKEEEMNS